MHNCELWCLNLNFRHRLQAGISKLMCLMTASQGVSVLHANQCVQERIAKLPPDVRQKIEEKQARQAAKKQFRAKVSKHPTTCMYLLVFTSDEEATLLLNVKLLNVSSSSQGAW